MSWIKRILFQNIYPMIFVVGLVAATPELHSISTFFVEPTPIQPVQGGSGVGITVSGDSNTTGSRKTREAAKIQPIYVPQLVVHTANSYSKVCISYKTYDASNRYSYQVELSYAQLLWNRFLLRYQLCASNASPTSLSAYAVNVWSKTYMHYLSSPTFTIPPGFGLVGAPSYVVTKFPFSQIFSNITPYGELTITANASLQLNVSSINTYSQQGPSQTKSLGPFLSPGYPWPMGGIPIEWSNPGNYSLNASLLWKAHWSLDGQSGFFSPVTTSFEIPEFQVKSLQALRTIPS